MSTGASPTSTPNTAAEWPYDATRDAVLYKMKHTKRSERSEIFAAILAGQPFAHPGSRDHTLQQVASWLAFYACDGDPEAITDILIPSLEVMEEASPTDFISWEDAFSKVVRAQNDAREKERARREIEARMTAALFRPVDPNAPKRAIPKLPFLSAAERAARDAANTAPTIPTAPAVDPIPAAPRAVEPSLSGAARSAVVPGVASGRPAKEVTKKVRWPWEK